MYKWLVWGLLLVFGGCDSGSQTPLDDFLKTTPEVCKNYCEEKVACERPSSIGEADDASFTVAVHQCEVACASVAEEGAFIWRPDTSGLADRVYTSMIDGTAAMDLFGCMYDYGSYRCVDVGNGYEHRFNPPIKSVCDLDAVCIESLETDNQLVWRVNQDGVGGHCVVTGDDHVEAMFFW